MNRSKSLIAVLAVGMLALAACSSAGADDESSGKKKAKAKAESSHEHEHDMTAAEMAAMDDTVDDRGFAALENGEQHGHSFTQAVSDADRIELGRQLALAREVALQYPTVADAEAAGLRRAGPFSPGLGAHYISAGNGLGSADGQMTDDAIGKPVAWIYDGTHQDSRIAGLFYSTSLKDPVGFAGPNDTWHLHRSICIVTTPEGIDTPLGADNDATTKQCDAVGGFLIKRTGYLLHVWVVPGYESPEGVFSHLSSAVTCDDGTYEIIADVTKVGTRTSVCRDGTE